MLIRLIKLLNRVKSYVRDFQCSLVIHAVREKFVERFLNFIFSFDLKLLFGDVFFYGRDDWLLDLLIKILHPLLNNLLIRCQSKNDHKPIEVLYPQIPARALLAPVLEQIAEHRHVLFVDFRV